MGKKAPLQTRDVGKMGEDAFRNWCSDASLLVTESNPDRMGWDFLVEFEPEIDERKPRDVQHILKKASIQVKSTDRRENSARASISATKKLVDYNIPCFIIHMSYGGKSKPSLARLLHIGSEQIYSILEAMREAEGKGRTDFDNITISLPLKDATAINVDGSEILQELYDVIPEDLTAYNSWKADTREKCGYNEQSIMEQFSISSPNGESEIVDLMIGLRKSLPVKSFKVTRSRFRITLPSDVLEISEGSISIETSNCRDEQLQVYGPDETMRADATAQAYFPLVSDLPTHLRRFRIANAFLKCLVQSDGDGTVEVKIPEDREFSIHDLAQMTTPRG